MSSALLLSRRPWRHTAMRRIRAFLWFVVLVGLAGLLASASDGRAGLHTVPAVAAPASQPARQGGTQSILLPGRVIEALNLRNEPRVAADTLLGTLQPNDPLW